MGFAVVVGGSTGVGRAIAEAWNQAGNDTLVLSRTRPVGPGAQELQWKHLDLSENDRVSATLDQVLPSRLNLVAFSSVYYTRGRAPFAEVTEYEWCKQFEVNTHGLFRTLKSSLPRMVVNDSSSFLHVSSEVVINGGPERSGYAATKAASSSLIDSLSQESGYRGVNFVQTMPAEMVDTPGIRSRRPAGFDYSEYMVPNDFAPLARVLHDTGGRGFNGKNLVVTKNGSWRELQDDTPRSQSDRS